MSQYQSALMGAHFRGEEVKAFVQTFEVGDELEARREASNQYDPNAIMLIKDGVHCGYIERGLAEELAPIMDGGAELHVTVNGFMSPTKPYLDIDVVEEK